MATASTLSGTAWIETARRLRFGERRKVRHCKQEPTAYISQSVRGVSLYCFRCGASLFEPIGQRSLKEIENARRSADSAVQAGSLKMPPTAVPITEGPLAALLWPLRAGITPEAADGFGFRWHEPTGRVLFPIKDRGETVGICGRAVHGERPKYRLYSGKGVYYVPGDKVVVVEDVLSCLRVAQEGYGSVALMGTHMSPETAHRLSSASEVIIWTDGDLAGDRAWGRIRRRMSLYPVLVRRIRTALDPKGLHRSEIRRRLEGDYLDGP